MIELKVNPVAKPRMTRSDIWRHRPIVDRYFAFKDRVNLLCNSTRFELPPAYRVEFYLEMPESWSKKKRESFNGKPHRMRPDLDNLLKALNDCLVAEDSTIWKIEAAKFWAEEGKIILYDI